MSDYWDLTNKERAALSEDDVRRYIDFELMRKGVLKPTPLRVDKEDAINIGGRQSYRVKCNTVHDFNCVFDTMEAAQAFLGLKPRLVVNDWTAGSTIEVAHETMEPSIYVEQMPSEADVKLHTAQLKKSNAIKEANRAEERRFEEQTRAVDKATQGLWDDWHSQRATAIEMQKIADTREEYVKLCNGDSAIADTFMVKTFGEPKLMQWHEWCGRTLPTEDMPQPPPDRPLATEDTPF